MKALVVYYSRTGATKKIAEYMAGELKCDIEEIIDKKDRSGIKGYIIAGKDAATKSPAEIKEPQKDASSYDIALIGTPVWAFTMAPAIRTYLSKNAGRFKNVAFFCTEGSSGGRNTFREMEKLCNITPCATLEVITSETTRALPESKIKKFIAAINQ